MDPYERSLLLENPFIKLLLRERSVQGASPEQAAATVLKQELGPPPSDEELLSLERALNAALGKLPPETTKALFAGKLEVKELTDVFSLTVAQLAKSAQGTEEAKALGLEHLWGWYWQREVLAYRRFLLRKRLDHDILDQLPSFWRPGVESKPFWEPGELGPAVVALEQHAGEIREELERVRHEGAWLPYRGVRGVRDEPIEHPSGSVDSSWQAYFFYHPFKGRFADAHQRCPVTSRVLEALPGLCRRELVLFSALVPGAVVPPHQGPFNGRLRVHLALTGSKGCYLRVGTQIREWEDGKVLAFDDSYEHQVCHRGAQVRVVLMFNLIQPGLTTNALDVAAQRGPDDYVETAEDVAARAELARSGW
jgi:aspartyl/asparaginyl beta-hydroxylase (cupin superfamily)